MHYRHVTDRRTDTSPITKTNDCHHAYAPSLLMKLHNLHITQLYFSVILDIKCVLLPRPTAVQRWGSVFRAVC